MEHLIGLYLAGAITPQTYLNALEFSQKHRLHRPQPASRQAKGFPQAKGSAAGTHPGSAPATHPSTAYTGPHPASPQAKGFPQAKGSAAGTHPGSAPATHPRPRDSHPPRPRQPPTPAPRQQPAPAPRQPPPQRERPTAAEERPSSTDQDGAMERLIGLFLAGDITPETYVNGIKALTETPPTPAPIPPPRRRRAQQAEETPSEQPVLPPTPQAKDSPTQHGRAPRRRRILQVPPSTGEQPRRRRTLPNPQHLAFHRTRWTIGTYLPGREMNVPQGHPNSADPKKRARDR